MAKRQQRLADSSLVAERTEPTVYASAEEQSFVVFDCANGKFAFDLDDVREILRLPRLVEMPLAPRSLLGLANLRGVVLPVINLANLLGRVTNKPSETSRVIVIGDEGYVGFLVDAIDNIVALPGSKIENADAGAGGVNADFLRGAIKGEEGHDTIRILDPARLLRHEFAQLEKSAERGPTALEASKPLNSAVPDKQHLVSFVSFELHRQEYGLPLESVEEIIPLPAHVSDIARAETAVLGVVTLRGRLLPLVSLRALLGLPSDVAPEARGKVLVLSIGQAIVGLVADRTREIIYADANSIDPAPALLTRGEGDAEVTAICRLDSGRRLVGLLAPDRLFRSDLARRVLLEQRQSSDIHAVETDGDLMADAQFVIFRIGSQEYGLPIEAVREIARPPEQVTKLPRAPDFIDGVMNLRGVVVPIVDLRRRLELAGAEDVKERKGTQRILVLSFDGEPTGFLVDGVSEVLRLASEAIKPAPDVSSEQMKLIDRIANLDRLGRMILLVNPAQLLDRVEADVLAKFDRTPARNTSKAS